jgi:hypothetical protein
MQKNGTGMPRPESPRALVQVIPFSFFFPFSLPFLSFFLSFSFLFSLFFIEINFVALAVVFGRPFVDVEDNHAEVLFAVGVRRVGQDFR